MFYLKMLTWLIVSSVINWTACLFLFLNVSYKKIVYYCLTSYSSTLVMWLLFMCNNRNSYISLWHRQLASCKTSWTCEDISGFCVYLLPNERRHRCKILTLAGRTIFSLFYYTNYNVSSVTVDTCIALYLTVICTPYMYIILKLFC